MATGAFARGALAELTDEELLRMLKLEETLFVEHKRGVGNDSRYQLSKAVTSFANALGGWVLLNVHEGKPAVSEPPWAADGAPPLVDTVRERLRGEIDPLPAFEAKIMHPEDLGGPVGVVRVYESADTPHIVVGSGAVFVREVAGDKDLVKRGGAGATSKERRRYEATQVRSQAQLRDLALRGERAATRVRALLAPGRADSLVGHLLGFGPQTIAARPGFGSVYVRVAPHTGHDRFRGWATTDLAASAAIDAAEELSGVKGLMPGWAKPGVAGVWVSVQTIDGEYHRDSTGVQLDARCDIVIESAGVVGAGLHLGVPQDPRMRERLGVVPVPARQASGVSDRLIAPVVRAALGVLEAGGFLGRARCAIDCVGLGGPIALEMAGADAAGQITVESDISLPRDTGEVEAVARLAATALGRSAGLPTWDTPPGMH